MSHDLHPQAIVRLTERADALARLGDLLSPVAPRRVACAQALGVLAQDVRAAAPVPERAVAARDGFAVLAEETDGASPFGPLPLSMAEPVACGAALPPAADAVLAPDDLVREAGTVLAAAAVARGEGVRAAGDDAPAGSLLVAAGTLLTDLHRLVLARAGVAEVELRAPAVRLVDAGAAPPLQAWLGAWLAASGCTLAQSGGDAVLVLGGAGRAPSDRSIETVRASGEVIAHGIAIRPGETAAVGRAQHGPVLVLPGEPDGFLAAALLLVAPVLDRLAGRAARSARASALTRPAPSGLGAEEVFLAVPEGEGMRPEPLEGAPLPLLAQACGWFAVPAHSEGYPAGAFVRISPL